MGYRSAPPAPQTLFFHDYETSGLDKARDRPMQFAGIRTDLNLNPIGEPVSMFCKLAPDTVPDPGACLLTGISPARCEAEGLTEADFARGVEDALGRPGTCGVGFNTIRFDDEITRHLLFRTMRDPYQREWANGNSRWDIVDLVRAVYALYPSVMQWPRDAEGRVSFRLENLAEANGLPKTRAHDALSDVETTVALARLVRDRVPQLFHHHFNLRLKKNVQPLFNFTDQTPLFHVSGLYGVDRACVAPVIPLAVHPTQANVYIVFDLMADPTPLLGLSSEEISDRVFRAEKGHRLPLTMIYANKSPVLLTPDQVKILGVERLGTTFDKQVCAEHWKLLRTHRKDLELKVQGVYGNSDRLYVDNDPELCLYSGFASNDDRRRFERLQSLSPTQLATAEIDFDNPIYGELLFRHRARNWPETLSEQETLRWQSFLTDRLTTGGAIAGRTLEDFHKRLAECQADPATAGNPMIAELQEWAIARGAALAPAPVRSPRPSI